MIKSLLQGLCLLFLSLSWQLHGLEISHDFKRSNHFEFEYQITPSAELNTLKQEDSVWQTHQGSPLNLGPVQGHVWVRIQLSNTDTREVPLLLNIDNNLLDSVTAYITRQNQSILTLALGDTVPLVRRPIKHEALLVPLEIPPNSSTTLYLKVAHHGAIYLPLSLWHPIEYLKYKSKFNLIYGILAGFILAMMLTNLTLFSFTRKRYFMYAASLIGVIWLLVVHLYGFSYRYLYSGLSWLQQYGQAYLVAFSSCAFLPLLRFTFEENQQGKHEKWLLYCLLATAAISLLLGLFPLMMALYIAHVLALVLALLCLVFTVLYGQHQKANYLAIYSLLILALSYQFAFELGWLSGALLDRPISYVCYLLISVIVSLTLTQRYISERDLKLLKHQQRLAQTQAEDALLKEKLKIQEQAQVDLESSIDERTFELQVTLRELEEKNRELERLNTEDALTKVKNRRYFDKRLLMEVRRSRREQTPLSLIMLDIDHFKSINDTYGHLTGDHAIRAFANVIKKHLRRPHDEVFRYGGEEFVVLLPNTELTGAKELAEAIRHGLETHDMDVAGNTLKITTSAGVHSAIARDPQNPTIYTDYADQALYKAKQQGRNRVIIFEQA